MIEKEKIEVFGTWVFAEDKDIGIMPYIFYPFDVIGSIQCLQEDYDIESMGVITLVEDVFEL